MFASLTIDAPLAFCFAGNHRSLWLALLASTSMARWSTWASDMVTSTVRWGAASVRRVASSRERECAVLVSGTSRPMRRTHVAAATSLPYSVLSRPASLVVRAVSTSTTTPLASRRPPSANAPAAGPPLLTRREGFSHLQASSIKPVEAFFRRRSLSPGVCEKVIATCLAEGLFREGWAVYRKAVKPLASQLSPEFYTASMYIAAMVGRDVEYVMVEAAGAGVTPTPHMHAALVVHWLSIQNFDEAAWAFQRMLSNGVEPPAYLVRLIEASGAQPILGHLKAFLESTASDAASDEVTATDDIQLHHAFLHNAIATQDVPQALQVLRTMIRTSVVPTQRTMELVFGCCRLASRAQAAADAFKLTKTHDIPLSLRAYNELLLAIAVPKFQALAMEVFETLKADPSVIPNEFTYDALIHLQFMSGNTDAVIGLRDKIRAVGLVPRVGTLEMVWHTLLDMKQPERVVDDFADYVSHLNPTEVGASVRTALGRACELVIDACTQCHAMDRAEELLRPFGFAQDATFTTRLVAGWATQGGADVAAKKLEQYQAEMFHFDGTAFEAVLLALAREGRLEEVAAWRSKMRLHGVVGTPTGQLEVMEAVVGEDPTLAVRFAKGMSATAPNVSDRLRMVDILCQSSDTSTPSLVLSELSSIVASGGRPSPETMLRVVQLHTNKDLKEPRLNPLLRVLQATRRDLDLDMFAALMKLFAVHLKPHIASRLASTVPRTVGGPTPAEKRNSNTPSYRDWHWSFAGPDLTPDVFAPVFNACRWSGEEEMFISALRLFRNLWKLKVPVNKELAEAALVMAVDLPHPRAAREAIVAASKAKVLLPPLVLESAVQVFVSRRNMLDAAVEALDALAASAEAAGVEPNSDLYRRVAEACVSAGRVSLALQLLERMPRPQQTPDSHPGPGVSS